MVIFCVLQGRALTNAIGNLELTGQYAEALKQLGQNLEDVASQVSDFCQRLVFSPYQNYRRAIILETKENTFY